MFSIRSLYGLRFRSEPQLARHGTLDLAAGLTIVRGDVASLYGRFQCRLIRGGALLVKEAEIVVIATPWSATQAAVKSLGSLAGKIVIDCTNPLGMGPDGLQLVLGFDTSAAEQVASWAPGAFVFKTLNTTGASNMARAAEYPVKPLLLVAGDEAGKKPVVMELVGMLGFEPVDAGPLKNARLLEPFAMVWIDQAMKRGRGRNFAFALVKMN